MKITNLGGFKSIRAYVNYKLELLENSDKTMADLFRLTFSEKENVMFEESSGFRIKKTTYGEVLLKIKSLEKDVKSRIGKVNNNRVGIYIEDPEDLIVTFWALLKSGYNPLLINMKLSDSVVEKALKDFGVEAVISCGKKFSVKTISYGEIKPCENIDEDTPFGEEFYVMSSGTKSVKICAYKAFELAETIKNSSYILNKNRLIKAHVNGELKLLVFLPLYHIFGFVAVYLWFSFFSRTMVKLEDISPLTIQNTIKRHEVTHVFAVPLFWDTVYKKAISGVLSRGEKTFSKMQKGLKISSALGNGFFCKVFSKTAFRELRDNIFGDSVKFMITGGSVISEEVLRFFNGIGYRLVNGYGMSEIGVTSVELSSCRKTIAAASIGSPLPTVEYKIDDDGGLCVKGTSIAKSVYEDGKKLDSPNGWYKTCDIAEKRGEKYYILGRQDDLIVSVTGENLNPYEIEEKLKTPQAKDLCLIGGENGNLPVLLVSVSEYTDGITAENIKAEIKSLIIKNNLSAQIGNVFLTASDLIAGTEFKLNRKRLKSDYYGNRLIALSESGKDEKQTDKLTETVRRYFAEALSKKPSEIDTEADFFIDEGGTSLDFISLQAALENEFLISFKEAETPLHTVNKLASYIRERI